MEARFLIRGLHIWKRVAYLETCCILTVVNRNQYQLGKNVYTNNMFPRWEEFVPVDRELNFEVTEFEREIKGHCEPKCQYPKRSVILCLLSA